MDDFVIIRGGGDLATGVIQKFYRSGIKVLILEIEKPTTIRRTVAFSEAVYEGIAIVEGMICRLIKNEKDIFDCFRNNEIPMMVDRNADIIKKLRPSALIDAIIAKKNYNTKKEMADITIGLGPGFCAGEDVDIVIETMRGHDLGRLIFDGFAEPNTGIPGEIGGKSSERVVHAPGSGIVRHNKNIGDIVSKGETIFFINDLAVPSPLDGLLRGLIKEGLFIKKGLKSADIDPRIDVDFKTISDKARNIAGGALEAYFYLRNIENSEET